MMNALNALIAIGLALLTLIIIGEIALGVYFIDNYSWIEDIIYLSDMNKIGKIVCIILNIIIFPISYIIHGVYKLFDYLFHL